MLIRHGAGHEGPPRRSVWFSGYWFVLVLIVVSYVICAVQMSPRPSEFALLVQLATVAATLWIAAEGTSLRRIGWIVVAAASAAVLAVWLAGTTGRLLDVFLSGASMLAYIAAPIAIIAHQLRKNRVDGQTLLAAIAAYLMVGMSFTFGYNFVALVTNVPTFGEGYANSLTSQLFFSFTTLTTTGYGNLVPAGTLVQSVAITEAITGQLFLVVAVAGVVSSYTRPGRG